MDCCYTVDWAQLAQMWIAQKEVTGVDAETLANLQQPPPLPPPIDAIAMPAMPVGIPPEMAVISSESFEYTWYVSLGVVQNCHHFQKSTQSTLGGEGEGVNGNHTLLKMLILMHCIFVRGR